MPLESELHDTSNSKQRKEASNMAWHEQAKLAWALPRKFLPCSNTPYTAIQIIKMDNTPYIAIQL